MKNKKLVCAVLLSFLMVAIGYTAGSVYANQNIRILIDGKDIACDPAPFVKDGRVFVPLRTVSEALGQPVKWDAKTSSVKIGTCPEGFDLVSEIRPFEGRSSNVISDSIEDCGVKYTHGYSFSGDKLAWNLGGKYTKLTFTLAGYKSKGAGVEIYGDDQLLTIVYKDSNTLPKDVTVDITGVKILRFDSNGMPCAINPRVQ